MYCKVSRKLGSEKRNSPQKGKVLRAEAGKQGGVLQSAGVRPVMDEHLSERSSFPLRGMLSGQKQTISLDREAPVLQMVPYQAVPELSLKFQKSYAEQCEKYNVCDKEFEKEDLTDEDIGKLAADMVNIEREKDKIEKDTCVALKEIEFDNITIQSQEDIIRNALRGAWNSRWEALSGRSERGFDGNTKDCCNSIASG